MFSSGQGQGQDRRKESGESFAAGSDGLGEAADDSGSRVTPGDSSRLGGVCRDIRRPLEAGLPSAALGECVLIMPADYIPISA